MTDLNGESGAHQAIGRFWCIFSQLEYELGETVKVIFKVQNHEAADAIVALADFTKKVNLVRSAVQFARRPTGEELPNELKEFAQNTLKAILSVNDERVLLAHSRLQPQTDGSIAITRLTAGGTLKINAHHWTQHDFTQKCAKLESLIDEVHNIRNELMTIKLDVDGGRVFFGDQLTAVKVSAQPTP
jgi:hypothetical protein